MSWQDCFVLGQQLFEMEDYNNTKVWLRESMERLRRHQTQQQSALAEPGILNSMEMVAKSLFQMGEQRKQNNLATRQVHAYLLNHFFRRLRHGIRAEPARARARSIAHTKLASGASEGQQCAPAAAAGGQHGCEPSQVFG